LHAYIHGVRDVGSDFHEPAKAAVDADIVEESSNEKIDLKLSGGNKLPYWGNSQLKYFWHFFYNNCGYTSLHAINIWCRINRKSKSRPQPGPGNFEKEFTRS
jgi:hypothetical protein